MSLVWMFVWLFLFVVVFGYFSVASLTAIFLSMLYGNKVLAVVSIPVSAFLSWKLTELLLHRLLLSLEGAELSQWFAFTKISWREEMLYLILGALIAFLLSLLAKQYSKFAFSICMAVVMVLSFSGVTQAYISLFSGNEFLKSNGISIVF
ncbi:hypothetical protein ACMXYV_06750 [Neptuniibacter sp. SY11_33]|uniref:hypothetical protein n=1 Tax=Neptuniibacter sp. SY11_33 TaxID=3398215 RepID=UPI0039F54AC5